MKENKIIYKKGNFIDEVFGENVEYVSIYDNTGITIIFSIENQIVVKEFKGTKELIEKFIEKYMECEFNNKIWQEQADDIGELEKENEILRCCLDEIFEDIDDKSENLCNKCKNMEE